MKPICITPLEGKRLTTFIAHYKSLDSQVDRARGLFEFESSSRMGSKGNAQDARIRMFELFGNEALAWSREKIERKPTGSWSWTSEPPSRSASASASTGRSEP